MERLKGQNRIANYDLDIAEGESGEEIIRPVMVRIFDAKHRLR